MEESFRNDDTTQRLNLGFDFEHPRERQFSQDLPRLPGHVAISDELHVALIDCHRFSREALVRACEGMPSVAIDPFTNARDCIAAATLKVNLIVYYAHFAGSADTVVAADLSMLHDALSGIPLIVMSDAVDAQKPATIRRMLRIGARGFIPTQIMGIPLSLAVMRFVHAGGTFVPFELMLDDAREAESLDPEKALDCRFTPRQIMVLSQLKQGKANKAIAHELGMSESTVKVHVRNIMRMLGATNRTEAACKAQQFSGGIP